MTTYGLRAALSNFHDDKYVLFLYREFVDDPAAWNLVERRRLLPLRRPHRPPAIVFQRGRSDFGRRWMESVHALRRLWFHLSAGFQYAWQRPQWMMRRGACLAKRGQPLHESQALE
jgi:hypothetical protein